MTPSSECKRRGFCAQLAAAVAAACSPGAPPAGPGAAAAARDEASSGASRSAGAPASPAGASSTAGAPAGASLLTRSIPSTGEAIPAIGLGSWQAFDIGDDPDERAARAEVLRRFFAAGGRVLDSSPMYGRSEAVLGDLLQETGLIDQAFLATKVWIDGREAGVAQMRASIAKMGRGRMDLLQVHNLVDWRAQLATLRAWKEQGVIRYVGATHYQQSAFPELERLITRERLDFVQLPYSAVSRAAERRLLPAAADHGVAVLVMRPYEGGGLLGRLSRRALPPWATELGCASWAQLALKFILGHPAVTCPIPATRKPEHMDDNMAAGTGALPDAATRERIAAEMSL